MQEETQVLESGGATEAPQQEVVGIAVEGEAQPQAQSPEAYQASRDMEVKARDMGWVPKHEWRGDPNVWRPAEDFVKRGEEVLPIVRSRLDRESARVKNLEAEISTIRDTYDERFRKLDGMTQVALNRQRAQIHQEYEAAKRRAVADGDMDRYDDLNTKQHQALSSFNPEAEAEQYAPKPQPKQAAQPQVPQEVQEWTQRNSWFQRDEEMAAVASAHHGRLMKEMPGLTLAENLSRTEQYVKSKFPEKFGITPQSTSQPHAPAVEGGGRVGVGGGGARGYNQLPPEAKQAMEKYIGQGLYTDDAKGRAEYAAEYWSQE